MNEKGELDMRKDVRKVRDKKRKVRLKMREV